MDEGQKVKAEDIEGLREMISAVIREERTAFAPVTVLQDVEELRRSPEFSMALGCHERTQYASERVEARFDRLDKQLREFMIEVLVYGVIMIGLQVITLIKLT